ncbi:MAG: hypothetical protein WAN49_01675, partial [Pseudolabrys sp.]
MLADKPESRIRQDRALWSPDLENRVADLERLVGWLVGLLIDLVAVAFGIGGALFVAGDYYRLSAVEGPVVFAFFVAMLATNFICR